MSYGGQSNAAWQRSVMQGHPQSGGFHQGSQMFMQNNMAAFGHGGMQGAGGGSMFAAGGGGGNSVSYPQPRSGLNPVAFQQGGGGQSYDSIGTVTKLSNDCGLVNNEVFFYRNVCKGPEPKLGDRVIFESSYSNNGQFKYNATRIQLMQQPQPLMGTTKSSYSSVAPPSEYQRSQIRRSSPKRSPIRIRHERERERLHRSRDRDEEEHERKRRREERSRDRGAGAVSRAGISSNEPRGGGHSARNEKERIRGESKKKERELADREREARERERARELELHRAAAPKGKRARIIKRYMVQIPKLLLPIKTVDVHSIRQRYSSLYIPSDFFHANVKWSDTFTPTNPFSLRRPCEFHIMHESVESPNESNADLLEPADANYLYSVKVMLMSLPTIGDIYKKSFETDNDDADHRSVHPSRLINFLVGVKGRVGSMAIGGPWSPSLDGENPDKDPSVLIRTAIRTCKALTGVDLSNCTQWYRFAELYYHRTEYKNMEKDGPPRVETVVIYLPDVHSCIPSMEEWQTLTQVYKNLADEVIARRAALVAAAAANSNDDNDKTNDVEMAESSAPNDKSAADADQKPTDNNDDEEATAEHNDEDGDNCENGDAQEEQEEKIVSSNISTDVSDAAAVEVIEIDDGEDEKADDDTAAADENDEPAPEPTHYSQLDLKNMKVQEIRDELLARNLPDKGVRNVVMARLAKALNSEKAEEIKNKVKNKHQISPQKSTATPKRPTETNINKAKKSEEKMEVDSETNTKTADKKKIERKVDAKAKSAKSLADKKTTAKGKNSKDDKEDWADIIDFELSDIVILDEYDSSKTAEDSNLKEMTEKEKAQLIRRYTLPASPQIIVHPNKQAKGGKFDCSVVSLSVLLDYHPDDSKERFFEVSLFAELFNDMLMRDFGFNIYKEIYLYEDTENTNSTCEITEVKNEGDIKKEKNETGDENKKEKADEKEKSSKKDTKSEDKTSKEQHNDDTQSLKSESRKRKLSTSTATVNGKDGEVSVSEKKMVVVKPQLLLSFVYFDTTNCGYIFEKDLEELFSVLGLNLSRSQIKKVLGKLATRQAIYYRKLTDKEESLESPPAIEDADDLPTEEFTRIAAGNNQYESVFGGNSAQQNHASAVGNNEDNEEGLTNYNGTIVHVGKLLNQINRTEKIYSDLEKVHNDLTKQHTDLQKDHNKSNNKIKDLQAELKTVSRKLTDANQDFYALNRKYRDQNATLSYIYTRVATYFVREKDKDKDGKTEGSREKEKDEKEKEKDKTKDKEGEKEKEKSKEDKEKKDDKNKEKVKDEHEKEAVKDDKEKEKVKEDKVKEEKVKEDKAKDEKVKDEKLKDDKVKEEKDKVNDKDDKEKEKEKTKDDKEKEKEKVKEEKERPKEKTKEDKEKPTAKVDNSKVKPTAQKNVVEKQKPATPAAKRLTDTKTPGKVVKKSDNAGAKK